MELRKKRKNKSKKTKLFEKAWKLCSEYIRRRDQGVCITCGVKKPWKEQQAGHLIHGKTSPVYFYEKNIHCQCQACNYFKGGERAAYLREVQKKYGGAEGDYLLSQRGKIHYYTLKDLEAIIEYYKTKLNEQNTNRNGNGKQN